MIHVSKFLQSSSFPVFHHTIQWLHIFQVSIFVLFCCLLVSVEGQTRFLLFRCLLLHAALARSSGSCSSIALSKVISFFNSSGSVWKLTRPRVRLEHTMWSLTEGGYIQTMYLIIKLSFDGTKGAFQYCLESRRPVLIRPPLFLKSDRSYGIILIYSFHLLQTKRARWRSTNKYLVQIIISLNCLRAECLSHHPTEIIYVLKISGYSRIWTQVP